jgi:phosphoglycerate kinase
MSRKCIDKFTSSELSEKRVFVRVDYNVPLSDVGNITDDTRIQASLPTVQFLLKQGAKVILCTHLGRPDGKVVDKFRLTPIAKRLSDLLDLEVKYVGDCIGESVTKAVNELRGGEVLLLENVRFHKEEEHNDRDFAAQLASFTDIYVNDAFGTAHRAHASTEGIAHLVKSVATGLLMEKELKYLGDIIADPERPLGAIIGGAKVSGKIGVIEALIEKCNLLILGGGMIFTFYKARGWEVGSSLVEDDKVPLAKELEQKARAKGVQLLLPTDVVIADKFSKDATSKTISADQIPAGWMGLDVGPASSKVFNDALSGCKTVIWNGPMGVFEFPQFARGTVDIARHLAFLTANGVTTVVGGGDSVAAVEQAGLSDDMTHISTGGGASLELLEGKVLPGVAALEG